MLLEKQENVASGVHGCGGDDHLPTRRPRRASTELFHVDYPVIDTGTGGCTGPMKKRKGDIIRIIAS
jgi:hypothetical protein